MSYIEQVANMLGVNLYEEFKIKPSEGAKILGHKENHDVFRFDTQLVKKGYNDGWPEWYGSDCERILNLLILGLYEVVKIEHSTKNGGTDNV